MKLELNNVPTSQPVEKSTRGLTGSTSATMASSSTTGSEDRTTFQSHANTVQALTTQALASPEVRQDKIDAIKQSISSGTFTFDAGAVADAMIAGSHQS